MADSPASSGRHAVEPSEWLRRALAAGRLGTWEWDVPSGRVTWSREVLSIFGIAEFAGTFDAWGKLVHPADAELVHETLERTLKDRSSSEFNIAHRSIRPDGKC